MNQVFAGATAIILGLILWGFGKKPKAGVFSKTNPNALDPLQGQEISLVENKAFSPLKGNAQFLNESDWQPPKSVKERKNLEDHLRKLISGSPEERLKAMDIAMKWENKVVLPILRRGLKDSDRRVVLAAASAIKKYRGVLIQE